MSSCSHEKKGLVNKTFSEKMNSFSSSVGWAGNWRTCWLWVVFTTHTLPLVLATSCISVFTLLPGSSPSQRSILLKRMGYSIGCRCEHTKRSQFVLNLFKHGDLLVFWAFWIWPLSHSISLTSLF